MKRISIVSPCYNEQDNIEELVRIVKAQFENMPQYDYEHIIIDNASTDNTPSILRRLAGENKNIKVIFNAKNAGHIRSPFYALMQATGDAVLLIVSDLQDPPELIPAFLEKWEQGFKIVVGVKTKSKENALMFLARKMFYSIILKFSDTEHISNFTGFGLYDQKFIEILRTIDDPYPYFRGMVSEMGYDRAEIEYTQPKRFKGKTKNNFYTLYDIGMLGFVNHSKLPLRMASFIGFVIGSISIIVAFVYLVLKLIYWNEFSLGTAPLIISLFFFSAVQLFFIGIIGEYIGAIYTQVRKRPLVIERERVNF